MRDPIAKRADTKGRSMNSEIVQILQDAIYGGVSLPMDNAFSSIYQEMLESDNWDDDAPYEKIDYLIYMFMERMDDDIRKFRELLDLKKSVLSPPNPETSYLLCKKMYNILMPFIPIRDTQ